MAPIATSKRATSGSLRRAGGVALAALALSLPALDGALAGPRGGMGGGYGGMGLRMGGQGRGPMASPGRIGYPGRIGPVGHREPGMGEGRRLGHRWPIRPSYPGYPGVVIVEAPEDDEIVVLPQDSGPEPVRIKRARPAKAPVQAKAEAPPRKAADAAREPAKPVKVAAPPAPPKPPKVAAKPVLPKPEPVQVAAEEPGIVPGEVLCEIRGDLPAAAVDRIAAGYGLARISFQRLPFADSTLYRWRIAGGRPVGAVVAALKADPRIASAQANHVYRLQGTATGSMAGAQYALPKLRLIEAHVQATGAAIPVAVIDSGVDARHPELAGAVAESLDAVGGAASPHPHGTAIAGIIGAGGQLVGAAPKARILAIRAFSGEDAKPGAAGTTAHVLKALAMAGERGARVVNLSFAGPQDPLLARAIARMSAGGAVIVAAAGNGGPGAAPSFPASDPNVIAVTATDADDRLYAAASRGAHVTLAAPGVDILTPAPAGAYQFNSGTSMAAAYVSGLAALILEKNPSLGPAEVRRALVASARDLGPAGPDPDFGAGESDALASLEAAAPAAVTAGEPATTGALRAASAP